MFRSVHAGKQRSSGTVTVLTRGLCVLLSVATALFGVPESAWAAGESPEDSEQAPEMLEETQDAQDVEEPAESEDALEIEAPDPKTQAMHRTLVLSSRPPRGTGLIIGGSAVVLLVAFPSFGLAGLVRSIGRPMSSFPGDTDGEMDEFERQEWRAYRGTLAYFIVSGLLALGGGAAMIGFGARRTVRYREWREVNRRFMTRRSMVPMLGRVGYGTTTYGLGGRF